MAKTAVELEKAYDTLDKITPQNFKTLSYQPKRELFMIPLGAAVALLMGYHLLMLLVSLADASLLAPWPRTTEDATSGCLQGACMSEWWTAFHFLRPQWLWLLLAVPAIYLSFRIRDDVRARWKRYIDPELLDHLIVARKQRWRFRPIHMVCLLIALGAVAVAGPTWRREQPPFTEDKAPLVIALDLSQTMDAIDLDPTASGAREAEVARPAQGTKRGAHSSVCLRRHDAHGVAVHNRLLIV